MIENYAGNFPTWLTPVQVKVLPITEKHLDYANEVLKKLREHNIRAEVDERGERLQAKIRDAQTQKIPYMIIVGDREEKENKIAVRTRTGQDLGAMPVEEFLEKIKSDIESKS